MIIPARDKWKEGKATILLNGTLFYIDGSKSVTKTRFGIYGVYRIICTIAATLVLNATVFQIEIIATKAAVRDILERIIFIRESS